MSKSDHIKLWHDQHIFGGVDILKASCRHYRYQPHTHDHFVIAAFKDGAQRHQIANTNGIAYPGTVMVIPPGEVHAGESAQKDLGWSYSAFYPSVESLSLLSADLLGNTGGLLDFGTAFLIDDKELADSLLFASEIAHSSADAMRRQEAVYGAFSLLIQRYGQRSARCVARTHAVSSVDKALEFMRGNLHQPLKISDIAREVELSEFHFMRHFKLSTKMTVHQYLTNLRLEAAKSMLAGGMSSAMAAANVGFYDQSHFTRNFRLAFGITPSRYATACR